MEMGWRGWSCTGDVPMQNEEDVWDSGLIFKKKDVDGGQR